MRIAVAVAALLATAACSATPPAGTTTPAPPSATAPAQPTAPAVPAAKTCTVPDVVGMVHQTAQDTMQKAGLYFLREQDASGQGRLLINDRNWKTVAQSVEAGKVVDCTTQVTLSATKIDG
ncbi:PASTA domain-containing protein [Lentzea sp. NPDC060358]|uniref:PASTA domain-containing protein n=1 Tax=Lentzea sp. NPDC060358 TaxID=3347103 RepID=UPI0036657DC7